MEAKVSSRNGHTNEQREIGAALREMREQYGRALASKIAEIKKLWNDYSITQTDAEQWNTFLRLTHNLAGSGATLGYPEVSQAARALELYAKTLHSDRALSLAAVHEMEKHLDHLERCAISAKSGELAKTKNQFRQPDPVSHMQLVWLYEPDATLAAEMERELTGAGYRVHGISHWRALQSQARQEPPTAFVVDWDAARETFHPEELMHLIELREERYTLPILFLSSRDDFVARLDAVRHGATAYLIKPMPVTALLEMIEIQTGNSNRDPYRILIIEDEETLAALYASFLESDGMFTQRITDPLQVMSALVDFRPDLILSDVNMPNLSGLELAAVLRQQEAYQSIPIVYLSGETDTTKQLLALHLGGDDFLIKPIEPSHLISKVASRVQRARILRRLAEHDSLTGLLDHSHLKEQLAIQVSRARRTQTALSFAMLDLDHFKAVNDMFGHLVGDRLLKSTARLLRQHLRDTDTVGRCGGEEFGIIFPDTDAPSALHLTREICSRLAQTCHRTGEIDFNVTVSAGVASLSCYADALALTEAADRALYLAKCSGRNQVVSADNIDSNWVGHNTKGVCSAAFTEIRR